MFINTLLIAAPVEARFGSMTGVLIGCYLQCTRDLALGKMELPATSGFSKAVG
jgi:hypothetical protein